MITLKEIIYVQSIEDTDQLVLVGDIGGTNSNFGICDIGFGNVKLLLSVHTKSKDIDDFAGVIDIILNYLIANHDIQVKRACIGCAGIVSINRDFCKPTNLNFTIDAYKIKEVTSLQEVTIINDFEAVGYGIDRIAKKDLIEVKEGKPRQQANCAIIGAGTGLGKNILGWDYMLQDYIPIPSEGGHADFPMYNQHEFEYASYLKITATKSFPITWEDILSGTAIVHLYNFLGLKNSYKPTEIAGKIKMEGIGPKIIFKYWSEDQQCKDTYKLYAGYYGRCAKNFALESLSLGGLYISGGIAAKNLSLFEQPEFLQEFMHNRELEETLKEIRICIIADYNVSLFGAGAFLTINDR